jgi:chaperone required for assembly of F1-ATPase
VRQAHTWDPLLAWAAERYGARLNIATGIAFTEQPAESLAVLERAVAELDDYRLGALHTATTITGSLVLALALVEGRLTAGNAFAAATLDEAFQSERWGADEEAQVRLARLSKELAAAEEFLRLL